MVKVLGQVHVVEMLVMVGMVDIGNIVDMGNMARGVGRQCEFEFWMQIRDQYEKLISGFFSDLFLRKFSGYINTLEVPGGYMGGIRG